MRRQLLALLLTCIVLLPLSAAAQGNLPDDPLLDRQWALEKINVSCAWQHTSGRREVVVAVIDSGVDLNHPDLKANLLDSGRDFVDGDDEPWDENGHGTNVAGIIAAVTNNGEGVAGIAGGVKILPIRVMNAEGAGSDRDIARGIEYAADQGAQVINLSLGSLLPLDSETTVAAIREARQRGSLVVVAAGNSYLPIPNFSFDLQEDALIVAATDRNDRKTDFSNYGPWIGISAPGDEILSTMPTYEVFLTSDQLPANQRFKQDYDVMSGTSQATPIVSAVAALLFSAHPDWDALRVRRELQTRATDIRGLNPRGLVFRPEHLGSGRIDACEALGGPLGPGESPLADGEGASNTLLFGLLALGLIGLTGLMFYLYRRRAAPPLGGPGGGFQPPPAGYQQPYTPPPAGGYQQPYTPPPAGGYQQPYTPPPAGGYQQPYAPPGNPQGQQPTSFYSAPLPPSAQQPSSYAPPGNAQGQQPTSFYSAPLPQTPSAPQPQQPSSYAPPPAGGQQSSAYEPPTTQMPAQQPQSTWAPSSPPMGAYQPGAGQPPSSSTAQKMLVIEQGPWQGQVFQLAGDTMLLGRSPECNIRLNMDSTVSRQHARLLVIQGQVVIEDLHSSHGTYVNGQRLSQPIVLQPGDRINIGTTTLRFKVG